MNQDQDIESQIKERFHELPPALQDAITASDLPQKMKVIVNKHSLLLDEAGILEKEILFVLLGLEPSSAFVNNVAKEINLSREEATAIAEDVNSLIFNEVRTHLRELEELAEQEEDQEINEEMQESTPVKPQPDHSSLERAGNFQIEKADTSLHVPVYTKPSTYIPPSRNFIDQAKTSSFTPPPPPQNPPRSFAEQGKTSFFTPTTPSSPRPQNLGQVPVEQVKTFLPVPPTSQASKNEWGNKTANSSADKPLDKPRIGNARSILGFGDFTKSKKINLLEDDSLITKMETQTDMESVGGIAIEDHSKQGFVGMENFAKANLPAKEASQNPEPVHRTAPPPANLPGEKAIIGMTDEHTDALVDNLLGQMVNSIQKRMVNKTSPPIAPKTVGGKDTYREPLK